MYMYVKISVYPHVINRISFCTEYSGNTFLSFAICSYSCSLFNHLLLPVSMIFIIFQLVYFGGYGGVCYLLLLFCVYKVLIFFL